MGMFGMSSSTKPARVDQKVDSSNGRNEALVPRNEAPVPRRDMSARVLAAKKKLNDAKKRVASSGVCAVDDIDAEAVASSVIGVDTMEERRSPKLDHGRSPWRGTDTQEGKHTPPTTHGQFRGSPANSSKSPHRSKPSQLDEQTMRAHAALRERLCAFYAVYQVCQIRLEI
jgi:hypothetical protein